MHGGFLPLFQPGRHTEASAHTTKVQTKGGAPREDEEAAVESTGRKIICQCVEREISAAAKLPYANDPFLSQLTPCGERNATNKFIYNYNEYKNELIQKLAKKFNRDIFENKIPEDLEICWEHMSKEEANVAGYAMYVRRHEYSTR